LTLEHWPWWLTALVSVAGTLILNWISDALFPHARGTSIFLAKGAVSLLTSIDAAFQTLRDGIKMNPMLGLSMGAFSLTMMLGFGFASFFCFAISNTYGHSPVHSVLLSATLMLAIMTLNSWMSAIGWFIRTMDASLRSEDEGPPQDRFTATP